MHVNSFLTFCFHISKLLKNRDQDQLFSSKYLKVIYHFDLPDYPGPQTGVILKLYVIVQKLDIQYNCVNFISFIMVFTVGVWHLHSITVDLPCCQSLFSMHSPNQNKSVIYGTGPWPAHLPLHMHRLRSASALNTYVHVTRMCPGPSVQAWIQAGIVWRLHFSSCIDLTPPLSAGQWQAPPSLLSRGFYWALCQGRL